MDAVKFVKTLGRMCNVECIRCEFWKRRSSGESCTYWQKNHPEEAVAIVEKWAKEHPVKTRQSEFLKQWPEALLDNNGIINVNPCWLLKHYRGGAGDCTNWEKGCGECRREYWLAEVEEK